MEIYCHKKKNNNKKKSRICLMKKRQRSLSTHTVHHTTPSMVFCLLYYLLTHYYPNQLCLHGSDQMELNKKREILVGILSNLPTLSKLERHMPHYQTSSQYMLQLMNNSLHYIFTDLKCSLIVLFFFVYFYHKIHFHCMIFSLIGSESALNNFMQNNMSFYT